jgi:hypothetical protein
MIPTIEWRWEDQRDWCRVSAAEFFDANGRDVDLVIALGAALSAPGEEIRCGGGAQPVFLIRAAAGGAR